MGRGSVRELLATIAIACTLIGIVRPAAADEHDPRYRRALADLPYARWRRLRDREEAAVDQNEDKTRLRVRNQVDGVSSDLRYRIAAGCVAELVIG